MAKKSFKENPALHFISPQAPPAATVGEGRAPLKPNPLYVETKSKRVQLLMQPSLHLRVKEAAAKNGQSLNDYIHSALFNIFSNDSGK